jgi:hypothetical protein
VSIDSEFKIDQIIAKVVPGTQGIIWSKWSLLYFKGVDKAMSIEDLNRDRCKISFKNLDTFTSMTSVEKLHVRLQS